MNRVSLVRSNDGSPVLEGQYADVDCGCQPVLCVQVDVDSDMHSAEWRVDCFRADKGVCSVPGTGRLDRLDGLRRR